MKNQFNFEAIPFALPDEEYTTGYDSPEFIRRVQQRLNHVLGLQLPLDGVMGFRTRRALRSFQLQKGLPADGIVRSDTFQSLLANTPSRTETALVFNFEWEALNDEFGASYRKDAAEPEQFESEWEKMDGFEISKPAAMVVSKGILKRAGVTTASTITEKTPMLIQTVLEQSSILKDFIRNKISQVSISKNFVLHGWDKTFTEKYKKLHKIVIPSGSIEEKNFLRNVPGFYHRETDSIHLKPSANVGAALTLAIHKLSSQAFVKFFGHQLNNGAMQYFANLVLDEQGLESLRFNDMQAQLNCAEDLAGVVGLSMFGKAYFQNHVDLINHLTAKLSIGPVSGSELANDALFKKPLLLRTARFANHQMRNMLGVGMTGSRSVRLWMRSDVAGMHELQILGQSSGTTRVNIMIPAGQPGDKTAAITYPRPLSNDVPLNPLTKYRYRIIRTSNGEPLGEGSFETSPAGDADTPNKVVIALISCNQPFTNRGTIEPKADKMLHLLPQILQDNNVKFVLPCGDQIYADDPGDLSLFNKENPYIIRQVVPKQSDIFKCSQDEVRRLYDMRYRTFWSLEPIRKMYANYPCYPMMDDHEIKNGWGTDPEHSGSKYKNVLRGALDAYFDYQASSVLTSPVLGMRKSGSFHYDFSYGNIGIFVMDIRSQRYNLGPNRRQMFSQAQFDDLQRFLSKNSHKKVLLIVTSVPVVFVPGMLADASRRLHIKESNFVDHWSHESNKQARNKFLSLLHSHQQAHPNQRVALACGDVHIGNAFGIRWQGGRTPRLYQFTSSALTALETRTTQFLVEKGPRLVSGVSCPSTPFGGPCSAKVSHLEGVNDASSQNPYTGLNVGLIEVQRFGDVSNLKFKLIGAHPTEERPVTYFESGWLG
jgi:alkaline phosphatase D